MREIRFFFIVLSVAIANLGFSYQAYVPDSESAAVFIIDTATNNVLGTVSTGLFTPFSSPFSTVSAPDGKIIYVGDEGNNTLYVIDANPSSPTFNTVTAEVSVLGDQSPFAMAITPDGANIYVTTFDSIVVFDTVSMEFTASVTGLAGSPEIFSIATYVGGTYAYAIDAINGIYVIDTDPSSGTYNTVINTVLDMTGTSVVFTPDGALAFVSFIPEGGFVIALGADPSLDTWNMFVGAIDVGPYTAFNQPFALAINSDGTLLFILDPGNQCIYTADLGTGEVIQQTAVALEASPPFVALGVVPDGSAVYITPLLPQINVMNPTNYNITTVTNTTSTPIQVPRGVAFNLNTGLGRAFQRPNNRR